MYEVGNKYDEVFAVVRFQATAANQRHELRQRDFAVVKVVRTEEAARGEVERLNRMNHGKGCHYFYQPTRLERGNQRALFEHPNSSEPDPNSPQNWP